MLAGPFNLNGCPVRRVNQAYAIATETSIDISKVDTKKFNAKYFTEKVGRPAKKGAEDFADQAEKSIEVCPPSMQWTPRPSAG